MIIEESPLPIHFLERNFLRVYDSRTYPAYTKEELLGFFGLAGSTPDGKTLAERLFGDSELEEDHFDDLLYTLRGIQTLVNRLESGSLSKHEETLAQSLAAIAVAQITREGDICPTARNFAGRVSKVRPDLISPDILNQV